MAYDVHKLLDQILTLEKRLRHLERHHKHCPVDREISPSPSDKENDAGSSHDLDNNADTVEREAGSGLKIITFDPHLHDQQKTKTTQSNPKWRVIAREMLDSVPDINNWVNLRQHRGTATDQEHEMVVAMIAGHSNQVRDSGSKSVYPAGDADIAGRLINSAKTYARITQSFQTKADLAWRVHSFQELVFVSLCAVLERHGIPLSDIDEIMRICISNSHPTNLHRLRCGALWVNEIIVGLVKAGWHHRATELFLLC